MTVFINFNMQHQQQTNWCWAAVSTSVALYYAPGSGWTQCAVANKALSRTDCCGSGAGGACNVYGFLNLALTVVGHLASWQSGTVPFATVTAEIAAGRPLGLRVAWDGGGAHFIAAVGTVSIPIGLSLVAVADSIYGNGFFAYGSKYRGSGTWTHSYFTQATPQAGAKVS